MRLGIREKMSIVIMFFIFELGILTVARTYTMNVNKEAMVVVNQNVSRLYDIEAFRSSVAKLVVPVSNYLITADIKEEKNKYMSYRKEAEDLMIKMEKDVGTFAEDEHLLSDLKNKLITINDIALKIFLIKMPVGNPEAGKLLVEMGSVAESTSEETDRFYHIFRQQLDISKIEELQSWHNLMAIGYIVLFVTLAAMVMSVLLFRKYIIAPIFKMKDMALSVGRGDYSQRMNIVQKDEIGELANAFDVMIQYLYDMQIELDKRQKDLESYSKSLEGLIDKKTSELIQAGKMAGIGHMAAGIAHEINNPLMSIMGYSQLVMANKDLPGSIRDDLQNIEKEVKRCLLIIDHLLDFAKPQTVNKVKCDINAALDETLRVVKYSIEREKVNIATEYAKNLPVVLADKQRLQQVFMNMIINAYRAMPGGGKLKILTKVTKDNSFVEISFKDTGAGISDDLKSKIFEPFFTTSYDRGIKGVGLGLSICHSIIKEHGGRVEFDSMPGKGSIFRVILPV